MTGRPDVPTVVRTMKAGAEDFLTKPINSQQLLQAVEGAIAHHKASREVKAKLDVLRDRLTKLTARERQVFKLVVRGEMNKQIASAWSDRTDHQGPPPASNGKDGSAVPG